MQRGKHKRREDITATTVNARRLPYSIPIVKTKKAFDENLNQPVTVMMETEVSKENVSRLATNRGYSVKIEESEDGYKLELNPSVRL